MQMNTPNLASVNHAGVGRASMDSQVGLKGAFWVWAARGIAAARRAIATAKGDIIPCPSLRTLVPISLLYPRQSGRFDGERPPASGSPPGNARFLGGQQTIGERSSGVKD